MTLCIKSGDCIATIDIRHIKDLIVVDNTALITFVHRIPLDVAIDWKLKLDATVEPFQILVDFDTLFLEIWR